MFSIWIDTKTTLDNITFLQRAHDDNFTHLYNTTNGFPDYIDTNLDGTFEPGPGEINGNITPNNMVELDGLKNPAAFLTAAGYKYLSLLNENIDTIINFIYAQVTQI